MTQRSTVIEICFDDTGDEAHTIHFAQVVAVFSAYETNLEEFFFQIWGYRHDGGLDLITEKIGGREWCLKQFEIWRNELITPQIA